MRIDTLSYAQLKKGIFNPFSLSTRPVSNASFALNYYFNQYNLRGYHLVNIAIHIFNGFLLFIFCRLLLESNTRLHNCRFSDSEKLNHTVIAFLAALIWATHPLHTNSVTYIIQRMNSLASMFYLASFIFYIKGRLAVKASPNETLFKIRKHYLWFSGAAVAWIMSLGCKETTIMLPFAVLLFEFYFLQSFKTQWLRHNIGYFIIIGLFFIIIAFSYLGVDPIKTLSSLNDFSNNSFSFQERVITQIRVIIYYISLIFFPHPSRLNMDYDYPLSHSLTDPSTTLVALFAIIFILLFALYSAKKNRLLSFCILWYFINLIIESSVIPLAIIFEHRTYLPSMLVVLMAIVLFQQSFKSKWFKAVAYSIVIIFLSLWTFQRNNVWDSRISLWEDCVNKSPYRARSHNNLGIALTDKVDSKILTREEERAVTNEAILHYKKAIHINPNFFEVYINLGAVLEENGTIDKAVQYYRTALMINPNSDDAYYNLGNAFAKQNKMRNAIEYYQRALEKNPVHEQAHSNLGNALLETGRIDDAIIHHQKALQIHPNSAEICNNLANAFNRKGDIDQAIAFYSKALKLDPTMHETPYNLGLLHVKKGNLDTAVELYRQSLALNPDDAEVHNALGLALMLKGNEEKAIDHFQQALKIDDTYVDAHCNLANVLKDKNKTDAALTHYYKALSVKPESKQIHYNIGVILTQLGKTKKAIHHFSKTVELDPNFLEARIYLAQLYKDTAQNDKLVKQYYKILQIKPDFAEIHYYLGYILAKYYQKIDKALFHFSEAHRLKPDFKEAKTSHDNLLKTKKQLTEIISKITEILKRNPQNPFLHYKLGQAYHKIGKKNEAASEYKKALSIDEKFLPALNRLAEQYSESENYDEAIAYYKKIAQYNPAIEPTIYYNVACLYARKHNMEKAIDFLKKAIDAGYDNLEMIENDEDLKYIRETPEFEKIVTSLR